MFNEFGNGIFDGTGVIDPAIKFLAGYGYDPTAYIATAKLLPSPYTTTALIQARIGGKINLIQAVDDSQPPVGTLDPNNPPNNPAVATLNSIIQNVTTEINGYLSSIYPIPLAQTGTVAIVRVKEVSSDGLGAVTAIEMVENGNYLAAPEVANSPAYLRHLDPDLNELHFGGDWSTCQKGAGLALTVTYAATQYSDESGQSLTAQTVSGTPVIAAAGTGYKQYDLLVLVGGSSFVPAKVREAALALICYELNARRLAPPEYNNFSPMAKKWRGDRDKSGILTEIGEGNMQLDGTYKRSFTPVMSWNRMSVLNGANSR